MCTDNNTSSQCGHDPEKPYSKLVLGCCVYAESPEALQSKLFNGWLIFNEKSNDWVAPLLDVTPTRVSAIRRSGKCTPSQRVALSAAGVDEEFLPVASSGKPGRQRKSDSPSGK